MNLYKIIKQNQKLAEKRNPAFDTNRFAKFLIYFMIVYWAALFLFFGVMLPVMFHGATVGITRNQTLSVDAHQAKETDQPIVVEIRLGQL